MKGKLVTNSEGFSLLEILVALTITILAISAAILVQWGNQSAVVSSQTGNEALSKAEGLLDQVRWLSRQNFNSVVSIAPVPDGIYIKSLEVKTLDFYTKQVTAKVSWQTDEKINRNFEISTLLTNFTAASSGDTCSQSLTGDWTKPQIKSFSFNQLIGDSAGSYSLSAIDANQGKLYLTAGGTLRKTDPTFFVFDISDPLNPVLKSKTDNATTTVSGLAAIKVANNYAYVANAFGSNFNSCSQGQTCGQLQVIDTTTAIPTVVSSFKIPGVLGSGGQGAGNSVFYKNGLVYLGLAKAANSTGTEFNVINVSDPVLPAFMGGLTVGAAVNDLKVKGDYAYIATPNNFILPANNEELTVLDVSNPANVHRVGGFAGSDNQGHGKSLYLVGNSLYLGRTVTSSANPELYVLDNSNPATNLPLLGGQKISSSVNALITRDYLSFLITTNGQFEVWNVSSPQIGFARWDTAPVVLPAQGDGAAMDCEGNYFYVVSNDSSNQGSLSIITAGP